MDLSKMTTEEIKAIGYDQAVLLEQTKLNLQLISQELQKRSSDTKLTGKK